MSLPDSVISGRDPVRRHRYFAYGSNMSVRQMATRCPEAVVVGPALLHDYVFRINLHGVATVVPSPESVIYGVAWEISDRDLANLDRYEGVPSFYVRESTFVEVKGEVLPALIYLAVDSMPGVPREVYLEGIVAAAREHGLPQEYVEELRALMMVEVVV